MSERSDFLSSIASTISDYRDDELDPPTPDHVDKWICQFPKDVQLPMLKEMDNVLKVTYFSRSEVVEYVNGVLVTKKLAGDTPEEYWKSANFLDIQQYGESQKEFLEIFSECLLNQFGIPLDECGTPEGDYIYLDDIIFTGLHVGGDLQKWIINEAPEKASIHVIVIAYHTFGQWKVQERLDNVISSVKKKIKITYWRCKEIENRLACKNASEVLWPVVLPKDPILMEYLNQSKKYPFVPRTPCGKFEPFSSDEGRQLLEREFLMAGLKIRSLCENPSDSMRPLGFSPFGLGFGSMIITYRNCPNNCPLALWWGNPEADSFSPLSKWYPLVQRKTNSDYD